MPHGEDHQSRHQAGGADALSGNLDATARLGVRKNSAGSVFSRRRLNLIEGSNVTLTVADDSGNEEVDVTIASTGGGGSGPTTVLKPSDETIAASTVLQNDDHLSHAVTAGQIWFVEAFLLVNAANATMDAKFGWSVPAGAAMTWGAGGVAGSTAQPGYSAMPIGSTPIVMLGAAETLLMGTAVGTVGFHIAGVFVNGGTGGNLVLQWAQNTSDAGNLTMKANSFLRATLLA